MHSAGIEKAFASRHHSTVIRIIDDDGVLIESVLLQLGEALGNVPIHPLHGIGILGVVFPDHRKVGMIREKSHFSGIIFQLLCLSMRLAFMTGGCVVNAKEGLTFLTSLPTILNALNLAPLFSQIPSRIIVPSSNVVVGLPGIRGMVSCLL